MFVAPFLADLNRKDFLTKRRTYEIERAAPCIVYSIGRMGGSERLRECDFTRHKHIPVSFRLRRS